MILIEANFNEHIIVTNKRHFYFYITFRDGRDQLYVIDKLGYFVLFGFDFFSLSDNMFTSILFRDGRDQLYVYTAHLDTLHYLGLTFFSLSDSMCELGSCTLRYFATFPRNSG